MFHNYKQFIHMFMVLHHIRQNLSKCSKSNLSCYEGELLFLQLAIKHLCIVLCNVTLGIECSSGVQREYVRTRDPSSFMRISYDNNIFNIKLCGSHASLLPKVGGHTMLWGLFNNFFVGLSSIDNVFLPMCSTFFIYNPHSSL